MTRLLDKMLGLAARKETGSAGCPPDTWLEYCADEYRNGGYAQSVRCYGHQTPSCGVSYTYNYSCVHC